MAILQGAYAERFEAMADEPFAFKLWVPERRTQLKARADVEDGELPLYQLSVRANVSKQAQADGSVGNEETVQLYALVEAWGTFDRRDEVVLSAVASALVDALPANAALPLIARLVERHYEQRTMAACEAQLASGARGRGAHTVPLRADERLDQEARSCVRTLYTAEVYYGSWAWPAVDNEYTAEPPIPTPTTHRHPTLPPCSPV